jgi:hypothetical protein
MNNIQKPDCKMTESIYTKAAVWSFCLFTFLKQFYIFPSGSVGIGDIFLMLAAMLAACGILREKNGKWFYKEDIFWYLFMILVIVINGSYFIRTGNREFMKYTLYWIYCSAAIWLFRTLMSEAFLRNTCLVCKVNLLFQLALLLTGHGRLWHETWGASRFMGTFNDPNQFAFFVFTMILFLYLDYTIHPQRKSFWLFFAVYLYLLVNSKSTGMLLGTAVFCFAGVNVAVWKTCKKRNKTWIWGLLLATAVLAAAIGLYLIWPPKDFNLAETSYSMLNRIRYKIWQFSKGNVADFLYDRKLERIVQYPRYLLYGAGEGAFERFPLGDFIAKISPDVFDVERAIEIHCSLLSVCFCYGVTAMILILAWLFVNGRYMNGWQLAAVLAIGAESFTLMNCRQPFFWFIFIFASAWHNRKSQ